MNIDLANIDFNPGQGGGGITPSTPEVQPLFNKSDGYLKYVSGVTYVEGMSNVGVDTPNINNNSVKNLCNTIGDRVYAYNPTDNRFFAFNNTTFSFDEYELSSYESTPQQIYPMWSDSQGRVYYGNSYRFYTIDDVNKTVQLIPQDLGGDFQEHTGTIKSNIIKKDDVVYMISRTNACAYIFNEETQSFDSSIPVQGTFPSNTFYRYLSEFEGHWIYDAGSTQTELVFHLDEAEPYAEWVNLSERLFPGAWSYEYEGQTINETTRGVFIHPVVKNGVTDWYTFGYANPVMYKLVNGAWEIVSYNQNVAGMSTNAGGCACGTLWFGFAYLNNVPNNLIIWNMDDSAMTRQEFYGWYDVDSEINRLDTRIDSTRAQVTEQLQMLYNGMTSLQTAVESITSALSALDARVTALENK